MLCDIGCSAPFSIRGTSCLYVTSDGYSWDAGRTECQSLGGDMAMLKTGVKHQEAIDYLDEVWTSIMEAAFAFQLFWGRFHCLTESALA